MAICNPLSLLVVDPPVTIYMGKDKYESVLSHFYSYFLN